MVLVEIWASKYKEAQITHRKFITKRQSFRHILICLFKVKVKERILRAVKEKHQVAYKGKPIRLTADFSAETLQARMDWVPIFASLNQTMISQEFCIQ